MDQGSPQVQSFHLALGAQLLHTIHCGGFESLSNLTAGVFQGLLKPRLLFQEQHSPLLHMCVCSSLNSLIGVLSFQPGLTLLPNILPTPREIFLFQLHIINEMYVEN